MAITGFITDALGWQSSFYLFGQLKLAVFVVYSFCNFFTTVPYFWS